VQPIGAHTLPLADQVFNAERKIILGLAEKPCVIVGRCADYIFRTCEEIDRKDLLNIFIYADFDDKVKRVAERLSIDEKEAAKTVSQVDKRRANHYNTFTEDVWGDRQNYDLIVNSSTLGIDQTIEMLTSFIKKA
jgi:cytidylate kinase